VDTFRCSNQKGMGQYFGRAVEKAVGEMMQTNTRITKLGFSCEDAHWRDVISRATIKNNDLARRRRKKEKGGDDEDEVVKKAVERSMAEIKLQSPPKDKAAWEIFVDEKDEKNTERLNMGRGFVAEKKVLPTKEHLQNYARSNGTPIPFSAVATTMQNFRKLLMDCAVGTEVCILDSSLTEYKGSMKAWAEKNERWQIDFWTADGQSRYNFTLAKQPKIEVSEAFAEWIKPS